MKAYKDFIDKVIGRILKNYKSHRVTGNLEQSLQSEVIDKGSHHVLELKSADYINRLSEGTPAGTKVDPTKIEEWIKEKDGLPQLFKDEPRKFSFIIASKINRFGIQVPNEYNKGDILADLKANFERDLDEMFRNVRGEQKEQITKGLKNIWN